jgi:hypothetical protein
VEYCLPRNAELTLVGNRAAGIRVPIEPRKIAARYFQPYPVACEKDIACDTCGDFDSVSLSGPGEFRCAESVAVAQPKKPVA